MSRSSDYGSINSLCHHFGPGSLIVLQGDLVYRTGQIVNVPIGPGTLGRVTDALGQPIDGKGPLTNVRSSLVEVKAPGEP
jgi:F0F1-type ATP synthase alpha subunit